MTTDREPIEQRLEAAYDEEQIAATWKRIVSVRERPRARAIRGWVVAGACVGFAVALFTVWPKAPGSQPLASRDVAVSVAPGAIWSATGRSVILDDESTITLAAGARLQVLANEGSRFSTLLQAGGAHFDVHPGGPRRWEIETALATVEVVGTAFAVDMRDGRLEVRVDRGVVVVHGERVPGRIVRLTAGQRIVVGDAVATETPAAPVGSSGPAVVAPVSDPAPSHPALTHAHHTPEVEALAPVETIASAIAEADRLSSAGDPRGAVRLLERVRKRGHDPSSGLVCFTLGRLYLDQLGQPELAAVAFAEVIDRKNPHSLLEDAYARRVEALARAGLHDQASAALSEYERAYPQGRRIAALRTMLQAP